jgi:hypothetical protein
MLQMVNRLTASALGFLTLFLVSACGKPPVQEIQISAKPVDKPELVLPYADPILMRDVQWVIITPENYEQVFNDLAKKGQPVVLLGLTDKGYENLALNLSDIRAFIQQQQAIILAYEGYYKQSNAAIDAANAEINNINTSK